MKNTSPLDGSRIQKAFCKKFLNPGIFLSISTAAGFCANDFVQ